MTKKYKRIFICFSIILFILLIVFILILRGNILNKKFANNNIKVYENNKEKVFNIEKIVLCNSANAIDLSETKNLSNLSAYQFTDIAIYINNGEELTNKTTIKELYIDNIEIESESNKGKKSLTYKNILNFGLKETILEPKETQNIYYKIINTNNENKNADYNEPIFYTDFSNPITLQYLNYDVVTGYKMNENNSVTFDGNILKSAGLTVDDLKCKIKFKIHIINNEKEKYYCPISINIPLDDIFEGTTMKLKTTSGQKYEFFREE